MKYVQPIGAAANAPYVDANPVGGIEGSAVPAAAIEHPMRELAALIVAAGLAPTDGDLTQVAAAIKTIFQKAASISAAASGTVDAITANFDPAIAALADHLLLIIRASGANASTTPTFTPAAGTIAAKTIVKGHNQPLAAGDISGAGFRMELQYDLTLDKWVLLNPATGVSGQQIKQLQSITASVAANALTLGLNATSLDFRAPVLTSGVPNTRTVNVALSLVVPSGATLGTVSGQSARLALIAIDNAGTVELAVSNLAGGVNIDETTMISTTAISGGSNSAGVIYSAMARVNVPFRLVGFVDITEAAAGTWATAPTTVQGVGGQAFAAIQSIGYGQTYQNLSASRFAGTTYYNTTGRPILVCVAASALPYALANAVVNGVSLPVIQNGGASYTNTAAAEFIVPPGGSYSFSVSSGSIGSWIELR